MQKVKIYKGAGGTWSAHLEDAEGVILKGWNGSREFVEETALNFAERTGSEIIRE